MTTAQKIIKYFAFGFAVFLIITIISAILSGGYALLVAFGLILVWALVFAFFNKYNAQILDE